jgi:hypothetical protein
VRLGFDQNGDEPSPWLVGEQPRLRFPDISLKGKKKRRKKKFATKKHKEAGAEAASSFCGKPKRSWQLSMPRLQLYVLTLTLTGHLSL